MKHSKIWYTCDRCGAKIMPISKTELKYTRIGDYSEPRPIFDDENVRGEIESCIFMFPEKYDLCPKCRKEFKRFMKNEA